MATRSMLPFWAPRPDNSTAGCSFVSFGKQVGKCANIIV